jgi:aminodeoxyfutalosine synthase
MSNHTVIQNQLELIAEKVYSGKRLSAEEGVFLFENADLGFLGTLANYVREKKNGNYVFFNRNFHIEPTNYCVFDCKLFQKIERKRRFTGLGNDRRTNL